MNSKALKNTLFACLVAGIVSTTAQAAVTSLEGQAGGGIVPWALLSSGKPTASFTWVDTGDYTLSSLALQGTLFNWVELSYARQTFDTAAVGLDKVNVNVFGAKVKILDMADGIQPALAVGVQYKTTDIDDAFLTATGADDSGIDVYLAATKVIPVFTNNKILLNATVRATKANQIGILGFGSNSNSDYQAQLETSLGFFLNDKTVLGVEYRMKPDNLAGLREDDWADLFIAYFPNENLSIVAAYAALGDIANEANAGNAGKDQRGFYVQVQANF